MKTNARTRVLLFFVLALPAAAGARAQTPAAENEFWPKVTAAFELRSRTRLLVYGERENGEDFPFEQWKAGALLNYRLKRIVNLRDPSIDEEDEHQLVVGAGYEYLQTTQSDKAKRENRIIVQGTGRHRPGAGFLLTDRNRIEFRWVSGVYNFRYRNKLAVNRAFRVNNFRFTPYASGELFWDRNHHSWNENQYSFGVQLPYKHTLMLDTFYLHQNCTTCSQQHVNVLGITLNFYFNRKKA